MRVELSIHAADLPNVAGAFKGTSDPFAVVTRVATEPGTKPQVIGKTEIVKNTLSPHWTKVFEFDFELGTPMKVVISVFDEVRRGDNKSMGSAVFDIGELLGARGNCKSKKLKKSGKLTAHIRKAKGSGLLRLQLAAKKLKNTEGFLRKSDPFFELSRQINSAGSLTWDNVFRSDVVQDDLNPTWKGVVVPLSTLCGGDLNAPIRVNIYDHESKGDHVPMGMFETSVKGLMHQATGGTEDMSKAISCKIKGKETGAVLVLKAQISGASGSEEEEEVTDRMAAATIAEAPEGPPTFLDYVSGGLELNVVTAIDFTGSNGNPRTPGTLHYIDPNSKNDYEKAISGILTILAKYDSDQKFPVLGFGAKYDGVVHHSFRCGDEPEATGVNGVLKAYEQVFRSGLIMSSPTDITEVMEKAAQRARETVASGKQAYTILLIVTDGAVSDVQKTADCLGRISDAPISLVIVGVGTADFSAMEFLDDANQTNRRDIAQFVEFNKHSSNRTALTSVTLKEIPGQVVSYFQSKGIAPLPPIQVEEEEIVVEEEEEEIDLSLDVGEGEIVVSGGGVTPLSW